MRSLLLSTALTPFLMFAAAEQGNAQAVAYPNQTLSGLAGTALDSFFGAGTGRYAFPIGPATGGQLDGVAGTFNERFYGQLHGHMFWRDPSSGLIGIYGGWTRINDSDTGRIGGEGEVYLDNFTLSGVGGAVFGDVDDAFGQAKLSPETPSCLAAISTSLVTISAMSASSTCSTVPTA